MRQGRRQFRPAVAGLEARQLLSNASPTLSTFATFQGSNKAVVSKLAEDAQGDFFGSTSGGGEGSGKADATVFEIPAGSTKATTIATFNGRTGYVISGVTVDPKGDVYGTISGEGGLIGNGTAFEVPAGTKTVETLASFTNYNGEFPNDVVVNAQGDVFGTAAFGGETGMASVYEILPGSNNAAPIAAFSGAAPAPKGLVMDAQGNLYGVNAGGGSLGIGSVYEIANGSRTVTTLATFNGDDGAGISDLTIDAQGNLYGTTMDGGQFGVGSVFEIAKGSNTITTLASFDTLDGVAPDPKAGLVMDAQGNLYGTTEDGGANNSNTGTVFEVAKNSGTITTLATFKNSDGPLVNGLALDTQGNLYGSVDGQGGNGGTVFKIILPTTSTTKS
jgi:uncharacterized repeat protein (TIGR03803 family)